VAKMDIALLTAACLQIIFSPVRPLRISTVHVLQSEFTNLQCLLHCMGGLLNTNCTQSMYFLYFIN